MKLSLILKKSNLIVIFKYYENFIKLKKIIITNMKPLNIYVLTSYMIQTLLKKKQLTNY